MANKKITIPSNIKNDFIRENDEIDDISLIFTIETKNRPRQKYNLSKYLNELSTEDKIKRRKEFLKIISFVNNTKRSKMTLITILNRSLMLLNENHDLFFEDKKSLHSALEKHRNMLIKKIDKKEIKQSSAETFRSQIFSFLIDCFNHPEKELTKAFPKIINRTGNIKNALILNNDGNKKIHTEEELKLMVSIFLGVAKHCDYILNNFTNFQTPLEPFKLGDFVLHFNYANNTMHKYSARNYKTTMLLFSFIALTGANLTPALTAKRKDISITEGELNYIHITLKCNRKSKIQEHKFVLKKNQLKFFNYIIENSINNDKSKDALLFSHMDTQLNAKPIIESSLNDMYSKFRKNPIKNKNGVTLNVSARTLRQSYANLFTNTIDKSAALYNSAKTSAKHYSGGDFDKNNENLQDAMNIYTMSLEEDTTINESKIRYIELKNIEDEDKKIASNGLICVNSNKSFMENKFKRRLNKSGFNSDNISCANVLACFQCENAVLTDSFETVYLLKSLKEYLEGSLYSSESAGLFGDRSVIKETICNIDSILGNQIKKKTLSKVINFIDKNGRHPLWETL